MKNAHVVRIERKCTNFILKSVKINEKVNTIFISPETSTSYFDVALNKCDADQGSVFCVWSFSCNDSICLTVRKRFLRLNVFNVGIKNHNFNIPLILDKCNIMIVMQKLKFMLEFTFAIKVECLHSSLHANLLMQTAHVQNMQKHVFVAYKGFCKLGRV